MFPTHQAGTLTASMFGIYFSTLFIYLIFLIYIQDIQDLVLRLFCSRYEPEGYSDQKLKHEVCEEPVH